MPGYIMHLAEGRLLEPHLVQRGLLKGERELSLFQNGLAAARHKTEERKTNFPFLERERSGRSRQLHRIWNCFIKNTSSGCMNRLCWATGHICIWTIVL